MFFIRHRRNKWGHEQHTARLCDPSVTAIAPVYKEDRMIVCPECKSSVTSFCIPGGARYQTKYYCRECDESFLPNEIEEKLMGGINVPT